MYYTTCVPDGLRNQNKSSPETGVKVGDEPPCEPNLDPMQEQQVPSLQPQEDFWWVVCRARNCGFCLPTHVNTSSLCSALLGSSRELMLEGRAQVFIML